MSWDIQTIRRDVIKRLKNDDIFIDIDLSREKEDDIRYGREPLMSPEDAIRKNRQEAQYERIMKNNDDAMVRDEWAEVIEKGIQSDATPEEKRKAYDNYIFDVANDLCRKLPSVRNDRSDM